MGLRISRSPGEEKVLAPRDLKLFTDVGGGRVGESIKYTYTVCTSLYRQFENSETLLFNIQFAFDLRPTLGDAPRGIGQINV